MASVSPQLGMSVRRMLLRGAFVFSLASGLAACGGGAFQDLGISTSPAPPSHLQLWAAPVTPVQPGAPVVPAGAVRVAVMLPVSAPGNAGAAAASMRNAAEMAIAEFRNPNIQLLIKDDGGTPQGAQFAAQQALERRRSHHRRAAVRAIGQRVAQVARPRGIPMIAFSTDANVAGRGIYLLSFLPESDAHRIVDYAVSRGKRSFAAMIPDNAYGAVVEAAFQQAVARRGGRVVALERYATNAAGISAAAHGSPKRQGAPMRSSFRTMRRTCRKSSMRCSRPASTCAASSCSAPACGTIRGCSPPRRCATAGIPRRTRPGYNGFAQRYRARYGGDPVRTASLSYDAVALIARLVQTEGPNAFSEQTLTNPSGFAGVDGVFRFRADGTNERGLAVMKVTPQGGEVVSPAPRSFGPAT